MNVNLYIYVDEVIYNETNLTCDSTLLTADSTLLTCDLIGTQIGTTNNVARKIDLFDDEKISITSSIQNINDISKVFTDYSQSFTIPASNNNNKLFKHWYENAIDNGFNQLIRYNGFIEIDTRIFRVGRWQLESASIKENKIENYKITFYGNLLSLTDKFGEDKLSDIQELNDYTIEYSGAVVQDKIETNDNSDLMFPLISSNRVWQFGGGGANDISNSSTPIIYNELAPALKIARIFNAIESKYNVTFNGNFLSQSRFDSAFLWLKNKEIFSQLSAPTKIDITGILSEAFGGGYIGVDFDTNEYYSFLSSNMYNPTAQMFLTLTTSCNWIVNFYKNNELYFTMNGTGTNIDINIIAEESIGGQAIPYYMTIQTSVPVTYSGNIYSGFDDWDGFQYFTHFTNFSVSGYTGGQLDLTKYVPDMKVADFVSGILKMFNLTAFSDNEIDFTFEQLENWYYQGQIKNFSEYTITDLDFERIKAYKKINFEFEKSESFMNRAFYDNAGREYANLSYNFNIDGSDFTIKLPFETLLFNKFTGNELQVAYSLDKKFTPYITKPVILYKLKQTSTPIGASIYFNDGVNTNAIGSYNIFGQDVLFEGQTHSLNFGQEISSYFLNSIPNSLFNDYYYNYLINLYSLKSRMVKVKMRLPYNELIDLRLNDRIVIRDKRYIINQFTSDLTTFEVSMELIQDFRSITFPNFGGRTIDNQAQTIRFDYVANEVLNWVALYDPERMIDTITNFDGYVEILVKANTSGTTLNYSLTNQNDDIFVITQNG